jgi:hypothetical protein
MKKIKLILLSLITVYVGAQDLNNEFLNSLPDDIKQDLDNKNARQGLNSQENYRANQYSSKLSYKEELLSLKDRLEQDLIDLERRLDSEDNLSSSNGLVIYGSDFFNTFQTSFMPINEPNPDSGYTLDIGDVLQIQLVGQNNYVKDFSVNSDGSISLPDIGKITIAGLSLNDVSQLI